MRGNNKKSGPEKTIFRYWFVVFIIAPAVILSFFFIAKNTGHQSNLEKTPLPATFKQAGEAYALTEGSIVAAPDKLYFREKTLYFGNNTVVADGGSQYIVIPITTPETDFEPDKASLYLVEKEQIKYPALKTSRHNPVQKEEQQNLANIDIVYFTFKVPGNTSQAYLIYNGGEGSLAWNFDLSP